MKLIRGETEISGIEPDEARDQLLGGYSHILVDEYQDIDQAQYDLVSAIAGRTLEDGEGRLSIMAVGDDDQNIYAFRGANVEFIRKFQNDYPAKVVHLVENYRSSKHIIDAANRLIRHNVDRMKTGTPDPHQPRKRAQSAGRQVGAARPGVQGQGAGDRRQEPPPSSRVRQGRAGAA